MQLLEKGHRGVMEKTFGKISGFLIVFVMVSILLGFSGEAANFTASISPSAVNGSLSNQLFNITINNTDSVYNITQINVTLPVGLVFINNSNGTSASNNTFSNTSTVLTWDNTTATGFIDMNGTVQYLYLNTSTTNTSGNYTITISLLDTNLTSNSTTLNITVDGDTPTISLSYPGNSTNYTNSSMIFNFTTTDTIDDNITCNLTINGSVVQSGFGAESGNMTSRTVNGLTVGQNNWSVTCWDDYNHVITSNTSLFGLYPDLTVTNIYWSSTPDNHTGTGSNVTFKATINVTGSFNASETINISLWWDGTHINRTLNSSNLTVGIGQNVTFNEITSDAIVTNGVHNITVSVDSNYNVTESNETNNNKTIQFYVGYNVTVLDFVYNGSAYTAPTLLANESYIVNIEVRYYNGDYVTDINETNLTQACDGACGTRNWATTPYQGTPLTNWTNVSSGRYSFNISTYYNPTGPAPGIHNITIAITKNNNTADGINYTGTSNGLDYYYLLVPQISAVTFSSLLTSGINEEYADAFNILATNNGAESLVNAGATIIDTHDKITFSTCSSTVNLTNTSSPAIVCSPTMTALAVAADTNGCFQVNVSGRSNGLLFYTLSTLQCLDVLESGGGTNPSGGTGPSGSTCSTDDDCFTGYYCTTTGSCVKKAFSISITSYTSALDVDWGSYVTTKVTVKNDGINTFVAKLLPSLTGLETTVLPESMTLNPGNAIMFTVNISAPETVLVGEHTGTIKAYVDEDTTVYETKPLTITVLTTEEKKEELNKTYHNYSSVIDELKELFERLKTIGFINQSDIDMVEGLINNTYDDLDLVKDALNDDDYATADSILVLMNTTLNTIRTQIDDLQGDQGGAMVLDLSGAWLWIVIGIVVVIVAVFVVYLFMPSGKKRYGAAYKPVINEGFFSKIGKTFKRNKKSKWKPIESGKFKPAYEKGYERVRTGTDYAYSKGKKGKIKGEIGKIKKKLKRKKPQKDMRDFFSS
jgi:RNAse (barnase) inhibitor barstar